MSGLVTLVSLSLVMAGASFLAGILPLSLTLSQSQLRMISTVGMGVLVGTSLIIIIPEGVDTLYTSSSSSKIQTRGLSHHSALDARWHNMQMPDVKIYNLPRDLDETNPFNLPGPVIPDSVKPLPKTPTRVGVVGALGEEGSKDSPKKTEADGHSHEDQKSPHGWIGIALITGFLLMYLIDKYPQYMSTSKKRAPTHHIALNNLGRRFNLTTSIDREEESDSFLETTQSDSSRSQGFATTIGLCIHAAADGIALGASSSTSHADLSLIIFFAIMVHKAPAAFGLTSILLKQGLSKRQARAHLVLFSLAAPAGAVLTWILAHLLGGYSGRTAEGTTFWTGMLLLFSGGTFLYVAMHAMQETSNSHQETRVNGNANGYLEGRDSQPAEQKASPKDLALACFGMILPVFLQIGHAH